jgi:hypothetical protein
MFGLIDFLLSAGLAVLILVLIHLALDKMDS